MANIFDQFDAESHDFTVKYRNAHESHSFHYTANMQEAHKKRPETKEKANLSPVESEYRAGMAAIAAKYSQATPDWFFFHSVIKVIPLIKASSRKHDTRPLA